MSPAPSPPQPASRRQGSGLCAVFQRVAPADTMLADDTITVTRRPREKKKTFFLFFFPPLPFFKTLFSRSRIKRGRGVRRVFVFEIFQDRSSDRRKKIDRFFAKNYRKNYSVRGGDEWRIYRSIRCNVNGIPRVRSLGRGIHV